MPGLEALQDYIELEFRQIPDILPKIISTVYQILDAKENDMAANSSIPVL